MAVLSASGGLSGKSAGSKKKRTALRALISSGNESARTLLSKESSKSLRPFAQ
jgi:hypothetical protein